MKLKDRLLAVAKASLNEGVESTKTIIADNIVPSFEDMGMANVAPGEFANEEITDSENLVNKGSMSNDTAFNKEDCCTNPIEKAAEVVDGVLNDLVDISAPVPAETKTLEIVKTSGDDEHPEDCDCPECKHKHHHMHEREFGESALAKIIYKNLNNKTCEQYLKESEYAGPLDFVPDVRINASDVLRTIKQEVGNGSEGVSIEVVLDAKKNPTYKVSQIDLKKLPKELHVENIILKLDNDTYTPEKMAKEFPLKTSD